MRFVAGPNFGFVFVALMRDIDGEDSWGWPFHKPTRWWHLNLVSVLVETQLALKILLEIQTWELCGLVRPSSPIKCGLSMKNSFFNAKKLGTLPGWESLEDGRLRKRPQIYIKGETLGISVRGVSNSKRSHTKNAGSASWNEVGRPPTRLVRFTWPSVKHLNWAIYRCREESRGGICERCAVNRSWRCLNLPAGVVSRTMDYMLVRMRFNNLLLRVFQLSRISRRGSGFTLFMTRKKENSKRN